MLRAEIKPTLQQPGAGTLLATARGKSTKTNCFARKLRWTKLGAQTPQGAHDHQSEQGTGSSLGFPGGTSLPPSSSPPLPAAPQPRWPWYQGNSIWEWFIQSLGGVVYSPVAPLPAPLFWHLLPHVPHSYCAPFLLSSEQSPAWAEARHASACLFAT